MRPLVSRLMVIVAVLLVSAFALVCLIGPTGLTAYLDKRKEISILRSKKAALEQEVTDLSKENRDLDVQTSEQELQIRRRLKLVKPKEKLFIFDQQPGQRSPGRIQSPTDSPAGR